jgi:threonylcarbamoyladenosine tRNA methylthiotransferase MtaB
VTRVYFHTFGCKANQYDTEAIRQALEFAGATAVDDPSEADYAVVNSCTVTHVSEAKMRGLVRRLARRNAAIRSVVTGCAAALDDGTIAELPGVIGVLPGADPRRVLKVLGLNSDAVDPVLRRFTGGSRAWLKIQDGCDEHCTFCATTQARGESRSRPVEHIIEEARQLGRLHAEIVITGIHLGSYGADQAGERTLGNLMESLVSAVPRVRFRLSSVEATEIDDRIQDLMTNAPDRLAPHVHAPLQSGSDTVLRRMGRNWYNVAEYRSRLERLAGRIANLGLGADVMVGFPDETDEDFCATRSLVESLPYSYLHVFQYSERTGTASQQLGPPVDTGTSRARSAELRALARDKAAAYRRSRDGSESDVVLLRRAKGQYEGLTEDYLSVSLATNEVPRDRFRARLKVKGDSVLVDQILD